MSRVAAWMRSVRGRLTISVTVLFAGVVVFGSWFLLNRAEGAWIEDLRAQDLAELEALAADLEAMASVQTGPGVAMVPLPVGVDGTTFTLFNQTGVVFGATPVEVFGSAAAGVVPVFDASTPVGAGMVSGPVTVEFITASLPVELDDGTLTLVASSPLTPVEAGLEALRSTLWIIGPALVGIVGILAWFVTGRAFRPVTAIARQVESISDARIDRRVAVPASRDEVAELAHTMNTMLDRLAAGRRRQREFVSDASHELRNPVAASTARLEVALAHAETTDWTETAHLVLDDQIRLGRLVDGLLLLARLDESDEPSVRTDVDLDDLVHLEARRTVAIGVDVSMVEPVRVRGDARHLARVVRNLVDNAARHAEAVVAVGLSRCDGEALLVVEDDGPGIPPGDRVKVFDRFVRSDAGRARHDGGAGLGLAIVDAVVAGHGGSVAVREAASGGARLEVRLPL